MSLIGESATFLNRYDKYVTGTIIEKYLGKHHTADFPVDYYMVQLEDGSIKHVEASNMISLNK